MNFNDAMNNSRVRTLSYNIEELENLAYFYKIQKESLVSDITIARGFLEQINVNWVDPVATAYTDKIKSKLNALEINLRMYDEFANSLNRAVNILENKREELIANLNKIID